MNIGGAFKAAWNAASDTARDAAAAIATGTKQVGNAVVDGVTTAAGAVVDAASWAAEQTKEAAAWAADKAKQGLDAAVDLAKDAARAAKGAFDAAVDTFKRGLKFLGGLITCALRSRPLTEAEQRRAKELLERLPAEDAKDLSKAAYDAEIGDLVGENKDWKVIDVLEDESTGYRSIVAQSTDPNDPRVVLAFAGTDPKSFADIATDANQHLGGIPDQYKRALSDATSFQEKYGDNLVLTGHSLGGGLGNYASETLGIPAVTINSAPLGTGTQQAIDLAGNPNSGSNSLTLATGNDVVSVVGALGSAEHPGIVLPVPSTTGSNPFSDHSLGNFDPNQVPLGNPPPPAPEVAPPPSPSQSPDFPDVP